MNNDFAFPTKNRLVNGFPNNLIDINDSSIFRYHKLVLSCLAPIPHVQPLRNVVQKIAIIASVLLLGYLWVSIYSVIEFLILKIILEKDFAAPSQEQGSNRNTWSIGVPNKQPTQSVPSAKPIPTLREPLREMIYDRKPTEGSANPNQSVLSKQPTQSVPSAKPIPTLREPLPEMIYDRKPMEGSANPNQSVLSKQPTQSVLSAKPIPTLREPLREMIYGRKPTEGLEYQLNQWIERAPEKNRLDYQQAQERILEATSNLHSTNRMLDLSELKLKTLPDCVIPLLEKGGSLEGWGLNLYNCQIEQLPENLVIGGDLIASATVENNFLTSLKKLRVEGNCTLGTTFITSMQEVWVGKSLIIGQCRNLTTVDSLYVGEGSVDFSESDITTLSNVEVKGDFLLKDVDRLAVVENVFVENCLTITNACIKELPSSVHVNGSFICKDCSKLKAVSFKKTAFSGSFIITNCPELLDLPQTLVVKKNLRFSCIGIINLPCITAGNVILNQLDCLEEIPETVKSLGTYSITDCSHLQSIKFNTNAIHGDLTLQNNSQLHFKWPEGMQVEGDISLINTNILSLPYQFHAKKSLNLSGSKIEQLVGTQVHGTLTVSNCKNLKTVERLNVQEDLRAENCGITSFNDTNAIGKNINFSKSKDLVCFSANGNKVKGNLNLSGTAIQTLNENLCVDGSINCSQSKITNVKGLTVMGPRASFEECHRLRNVHTIKLMNACPNLILNRSQSLQELPILNFLNDSAQRSFVIDIRGTNFSERTIRAFSEMYPLCRLVKDPSSQNKLTQTIEFWEKEAGQPKGSNSFTFSNDDETIIVDFLKKLQTTTEFKENKPSFAKRILQMLQIMKEPNIYDIIIECMREERTTCMDRARKGLYEIELQIHLYKLENEDLTNEKINEEAQKFLNLELVSKESALLVDEKKKEYHQGTHRINIDEVEIDLFIRLKMGERMPLPCSISHMNYARMGEEHITAKDIDHIEATIKAQQTPEKLEQFKTEWSPFQIHQRKKAVVPYEKLELFQGNPLPEYKCCITLNEGDDFKNGVVHQRQVFCYEDFKRQFIERGKNPCTGNPIDWNDVKKLPPKS